MLCVRLALERNPGRTRRQELTQGLDRGGIRNARGTGLRGQETWPDQGPGGPIVALNMSPLGQQRNLGWRGS